MTSTPVVTTTPTATPPQAGPRLGPVGWLRWAWRQLTSMRTALILLFLLAIASVPGSVLPQEGIDPAAVTQYYTSHPSLAPILNRLSLFSVFAAPWFAAIYLLLFLSLAGCVLPRTFRLVGSARQQPPRAPRRLGRLPMSATFQTSLPPEQALSSAGAVLGGKRFRLRTGDGWVSAEKGYLREVGNLVFHIALLALLASIGIGGIFGYKANRLLIAGQSFADTPTALDVFRPGRLVSPSDLAPFTVGLKHFSASYEKSGPTVDEPITFNAAVRYTAAPGKPARSFDLAVNHPLVVDNVSVYLIGHGYAPEFTVTDGKGNVVFTGPVPFIPVEQAGLTSEGVIKVPDSTPTQLGFAGVFLPSAEAEGGRLVSVFPAALRPEVSLVSYGGNLGLNSGAAQSVYTLDLAGMHRLPVAPRPLAIGQSMKLPDGDGTITYTGYRQWISLAITYDPGQLPALISAGLALAGLILSFMVRRRRMFVRASPGPGGLTIVEVGGLARSDAAGGFDTEFAELARDLCAAQDGAPTAYAPTAYAAGAGAAAAKARPAESESARAELDPSELDPAGLDGVEPGSSESDSAEPASAELDSAESVPAESVPAEPDTAGLDPESVSTGPVGAGTASDHDQSLGVRDGE